jgi:hypothetical protein
MSLEEMTQDQRNSIALQKLFNNPEVGLEAKRLYKKVVPEAKFPDLDTQDKIDASNAKLQEKIDKLQEDAQLGEITRRRERHHQEIRDAGFDPVAVEKVMTDEKIGSYDTAIKYMKAQNQNSVPTSANMTPITMPDNAKEISKNPALWARKEAMAAINDLKSKRGF